MSLGVRTPSLRSKKDLIEEFVEALSTTAEVDAAWAVFVAAERAEELDRILADEGLDAEETHAFVEAAFRDGAVEPTGTAITKIVPPVSRFAKAGGHSTKKRTVLQKLGDFFDRFFGLS